MFIEPDCKRIGELAAFNELRLMNTKDRIIAILEQLISFFLTHNEPNWAKRSEKAIRAIREENADLKGILLNFTGVGMGSLIDLYISSRNGHLLPTGEEDANRQLSKLAGQILSIKHALDRK